VPEATTILGAAKVSGKLGGWSVGLMDALTNRESGDFSTEAGVDGRYPVEPLTNYFVGRVRRDFGKGATVLGAMLTNVARDLEGNEFDAWLRSRAWVGGIDGAHSWGNRAWTLSGFFAGSRVSGSAAAIESTQNAAAHYYGRPDADYLEVDPTRTSLGGHTLGASISHTGTWDVSATYQEASPGFETNDIGFMNRGDYRAFSTFYGRRMNKPVGAFRSRTAYIYHNAAWNFGGDAIYNAIGYGANAQFKNFWFAGVFGTYNLPRYDDRAAFGGPAIRRPTTWNVGVDVSTDERKPFSLGWGANYADGGGGNRRYAYASFNYRPTSSVRLSVTPEFTRARDAIQYITAEDDAAATETFGTRYVFASDERTELAMSTRLDWTFTPTLSLQLYAQPYVSANDFVDYRSLARPRSYEFDPYTRTENDDFTFASLRGNAVLRWEYRPGSTLFFVWQQNRARDTTSGDFSFGDAPSSVFDNASRNVLLIKATYWLNR
jgi:hypothetical protein